MALRGGRMGRHTCTRPETIGPARPCRLEPDADRSKLPPSRAWLPCQEALLLVAQFAPGPPGRAGASMVTCGLGPRPRSVAALRWAPSRAARGTHKPAAHGKLPPRQASKRQASHPHRGPAARWDAQRPHAAMTARGHLAGRLPARPRHAPPQTARLPFELHVQATLTCPRRPPHAHRLTALPYI